MQTPGRTCRCATAARTRRMWVLHSSACAVSIATHVQAVRFIACNQQAHRVRVSTTLEISRAFTQRKAELERTCGGQHEPSGCVCFAAHALVQVGLRQPVIARPSSLQPDSSRCGAHKRAAVLRRPVCADWTMLICSNFHRESTSDDSQWRLQQMEGGRSLFSCAVLSTQSRHGHATFALPSVWAVAQSAALQQQCNARGAS